MAHRRVEVIELGRDDGRSTEGVAEVDKDVPDLATGLQMSVGSSSYFYIRGEEQGESQGVQILMGIMGFIKG